MKTVIFVDQALLTAGFIGSVSNQEVFVDGSDLYQPGERWEGFTQCSGEDPKVFTGSGSPYQSVTYFKHRPSHGL